MANPVYPPPSDWDDPKEPNIEGYELTRGWAIFTGKDGEDPTFAAFIEREDTAMALLGAHYGADNEAVFFDACAVPAVNLRGVIYVANDYRVDDHERLIEALRALGLLGAHENIPE